MFTRRILIIIAAILILEGLYYAGFWYYYLNKELTRTKNNLEISNKFNEKLIIRLMELMNQNIDLRQQAEQAGQLVSGFKTQMDTLSQEVGTIVKLRNLDEELLQKYSKVYFLNENYVPKTVLAIDSQYLYNPDNDEYIHGNVLPFLYALLEAATKDSINLTVKSAFRSFYEQANIKTNYKMAFGSGANKFVADQGYSEHQLGTTVDFGTNEFNGNSSFFHKTKAYQWLLNNAYKYGFILSYPQENTYYIFEPWHWRFVGIRLAAKLHEEGKYFYELDQRAIDDYLISIFDW